MTLLGLGVIEQLLRLINNLIEGTDPAQRKAQALSAFWLTWPIAKLWLTDEQEKQVLVVMTQVDPGGATRNRTSDDVLGKK